MWSLPVSLLLRGATSEDGLEEGTQTGVQGGGSKAGFQIRIQLNPDPAKNLNPDPEDPESRSKLLLNKNNHKIVS